MGNGNSWVIRIGSDRYVVRPGEAVVIGRKPIRPLPHGDVPRFEFEDPAKSVSKRHALFTVSADGIGNLKDLGSTNGTYEIHSDGSATPLPVESEFELRSHAESFRLGDVTLTFEYTADTQLSDIAPANLSLFAHASESHNNDAVDIDSPTFSVSDILEVRTGEPTVAFQQLPEQVIEPLQPEPVQPETGPSQPESQPEPEPVPHEYAPVYEPGSVFDRITKGDLKNQEPAVVIGNLDSNLAQKTTDMAQQYEMAQHREFLPFLALNTNLYDDLYAWLEAIDDSDIDRALENNNGYQAYKKKVS